MRTLLIMLLTLVGYNASANTYVVNAPVAPVPINGEYLPGSVFHTSTPAPMPTSVTPVSVPAPAQVWVVNAPVAPVPINGEYLPGSVFHGSTSALPTTPVFGEGRPMPEVVAVPEVVVMPEVINTDMVITYTEMDWTSVPVITLPPVVQDTYIETYPITVVTDNGDIMVSNPIMGEGGQPPVMAKKTTCWQDGRDITYPHFNSNTLVAKPLVYTASRTIGVGSGVYDCIFTENGYVVKYALVPAQFAGDLLTGAFQVVFDVVGNPSLVVASTGRVVQSLGKVVLTPVNGVLTVANEAGNFLLNTGKSFFQVLKGFAHSILGVFNTITTATTSGTATYDFPNTPKDR